MSPCEAAKESKRWRYYVSQAILQGRKPEAGSLPRLSAPLIEAAVVDAIRNGTPESQLSDARIAAGLEKVVVGKTKLDIRWRDAERPDGQALQFSIAWSPVPARRQREILQGEGLPSSAQRPMRAEARRAFASAYGKARLWLDLLTNDLEATIPDLADREERTERSIRQTLSLAFLDPAVVTAVLEGRLPRGFGLKRMMDLPAAWGEQWVALGLSSPARR